MTQIISQFHLCSTNETAIWSNAGGKLTVLYIYLNMAHYRNREFQELGSQANPLTCRTNSLHSIDETIFLFYRIGKKMKESCGS